MGTVHEDLDQTVAAPARAVVAAEQESDTDATVLSSQLSRPAAASGAGEERIAGADPTPNRVGSYRFRISNTVVALDLPAYIGRKPARPRVVHGPLPRCVRVPSPTKEVSGTHLEIRQLGSAVIVTDLRSTNGTVVIVPGDEPRKLRQGESVVVLPGTLVDIGDGNVLEILPMQRLK